MAGQMVEYLPVEREAVNPGSESYLSSMLLLASEKLGFNIGYIVKIHQRPSSEARIEV
jgi:hypothetical protein